MTYTYLVMSAKNVSTLESAAQPAAKVEIKVPALLAGTVTSVIVAVLASRLGVQGTLIGAAFTSLVFGLISPFLTFGLQRTHQGLKVVAARRSPSTESSSDAPATEVLAAVEVTTRRRRRVPLGVAIGGAAITALLTFGSTFGVVTALEAASGRSVDGGYTSTVEGITKPAATVPAADASSLNAERTPTPSPSPTDSPTIAPTTAPVAAPTPAPTPAATQTPAEPTASTTTTAPIADGSQPG